MSLTKFKCPAGCYLPREVTDRRLTLESKRDIADTVERVYGVSVVVNDAIVYLGTKRVSLSKAIAIVDLITEIAAWAPGNEEEESR